MRGVAAAVVASIYLVLCTVGPLAHTHVQPGSDGLASYLASNSQSVRASASIAEPPSHALPDGAHCPYCEWQANTLSAALPAEQAPAPAPVVAKSSFSPHRFAPPFLTLESSRAPPLA